MLSWPVFSFCSANRRRDAQALLRAARDGSQSMPTGQSCASARLAAGYPVSHVPVQLRPSAMFAPQPRPTAPHIPVIVPAYNESRYLPACLQAVREREDVPSHEINMVDNGPTDGTAETAWQDGVRVVSGPCKGVARGRHGGLFMLTSLAVANATQRPLSGQPCSHPREAARLWLRMDDGGGRLGNQGLGRGRMGYLTPHMRRVRYNYANRGRW